MIHWLEMSLVHWDPNIFGCFKKAETDPNIVGSGGLEPPSIPKVSREHWQSVKQLVMYTSWWMQLLYKARWFTLNDLVTQKIAFQTQIWVASCFKLWPGYGRSPVLRNLRRSDLNDLLLHRKERSPKCRQRHWQRIESSGASGTNGDPRWFAMCRKKRPAVLKNLSWPDQTPKACQCSCLTAACR